jgi:hypothetical protein
MGRESMAFSAQTYTFDLAVEPTQRVQSLLIDTYPRKSRIQEVIVNDNTRRWRQEPFAKFLSALSSSSAKNIRPGATDPPSIIPMEVPTEEVLNYFLTAHPEFADRRALFAELFHGRKVMSVNRDLWQQLTATV